AHHPG
ncbi:hypothetical protein ECEC1864_2393, partial [Escherichia coli EC1864]